MAESATHRTSDRKYRAMREKLKRQANLVCGICGQPIDVALPQYDPMSFTADHVIAVAAGGSNYGELQASHYRCNSARGSKPLEAVRLDRHTRKHY